MAEFKQALVALTAEELHEIRAIIRQDRDREYVLWIREVMREEIRAIDAELRDRETR